MASPALERCAADGKCKGLIKKQNMIEERDMWDMGMEMENSEKSCFYHLWL